MLLVQWEVEAHHFIYMSPFAYTIVHHLNKSLLNKRESKKSDMTAQGIDVKVNRIVLMQLGVYSGNRERVVVACVKQL